MNLMDDTGMLQAEMRGASLLSRMFARFNSACKDSHGRSQIVVDGIPASAGLDEEVGLTVPQTEKDYCCYDRIL
jgi:hypothetical protein